MNINWYPGHMKKTFELIKENLKLVDIVVEIVDARIPLSSRNPNLDEVIKDKIKILVLNKYDLSSKKNIDVWKEYLDKNNYNYVYIDSIRGKNINALTKMIKKLSEPIMEKLVSRGRNKRPARVMVVGIPNVGKSSLINKLVNKNIAKVGNKPGVTRGKQWIRINKDIELFDTPGVLWPKLDANESGFKLACYHAIKDDILNIEEIVFNLMKYLLENNMEDINNYYNIKVEDKDPLALYQLLADKFRYYDNNDPDYIKVSRRFLNDFRENKIDNIVMEIPNE